MTGQKAGVSRSSLKMLGSLVQPESGRLLVLGNDPDIIIIIGNNPDIHP